MEPQNIEETSQEHARLQRDLWEIAQSPWKTGVLPNPEILSRARESLPRNLPSDGIGFDAAKKHILDDIVPAFNGSSISPNYYGFVTGGTTPAALFADNVVSVYDQNVQVHLSEHSIATDVESIALGLLVDLFKLDRNAWHNGTFTTGATAANLLGLACGREFAVRAAADRNGNPKNSVGEWGLFEAMYASGLSGLQVLTTLPHSSIGKSAGILGFGRANVINVSRDGSTNPLEFDLEKLECELSRPDKASIVAVSSGEVNTGRFATAGSTKMQELRDLCDKYGAWLHVDGAFGLFSRVLDDSPEFASIRAGSDGLELADSITGDGHKLLNVPYDCGFFLTRHRNEAANVFTNPNAAYLTGGAGIFSIPSPLNIGIENSRRFRALPVYATLLSYGSVGYRSVLERQVRLARKLSAWLFDHSEYNILPETGSKKAQLDQTFMIVLFSARHDELNQNLASRINATSKMFVSGTSWQGRPACRIAISNWRADEKRDFELVTSVLDEVARQA